MRKVISVLLCLLFALTILFPAGTLVSACFGYKFELANISVFAVVTMLLSMFTVVFSVASKEKITNKIIILSYILPAVSFINAVFCIFESDRILVAVCVLISFVCISFLTIRNIVPKRRKIIVFLLCALMTAIAIFFAFMRLTFGIIGEDTVVKSVDSPNGSLYAQVVDSDQGAFGGDTIVVVYEKRDIDVYVFKLKDKPQRVYIGEWGEFNNIQIRWTEDGSLIINSVECDIE